MLGYVEGMLAEQSVVTEEQMGFGFFEPSVFALGQELEGEEGGTIGFRRVAVYPQAGGSPVEGDGFTLGYGEPWQLAVTGEESARALMPGSASFQDVLERELGRRDVMPGGSGGTGEVVLERELGRRDVMPGGSGGTVLERELGRRDVIPGGSGGTGEVVLERELGRRDVMPGGSGGTGEVVLERELGRRDVMPGGSGGTEVGGAVTVGHQLALAEGDFSVMAGGTARLLAESVMVLERQLLGMGTESVLLSRQEMTADPLLREALAWEMVYQRGETVVMPERDMARTLTGVRTGEESSYVDRLVETEDMLERRRLLPWVVEGMVSVLPGGSSFVAEGEQVTVTEVALLSQMRTMETATVGKSRVEREAVSAVALEQAGQGFRTVVSGATGATVEDFDRAVARDARRYDGI